MGFPANVPALWSFIGLVGSIVMVGLAFAWLYFCYFPGGYKKGEVMDLGEYAMFVAQMKYMERKRKLEQAEQEEEEEGEYGNGYDELYHEHDNGGYADEEEEAFAREFQSEAPSEGHDIEGGEYYEGTSSSSPSTQTFSQAGGQTYDGESTISPNSQGPPSQRGLKSALKSSRDDRSESYVSTTSSSHEANV